MTVTHLHGTLHDTGSVRGAMPGTQRCSATALRNPGHPVLNYIFYLLLTIVVITSIIYIFIFYLLLTIVIITSIVLAIIIVCLSCKHCFAAPCYSGCDCRARFSPILALCDSAAL